MKIEVSEEQLERIICALEYQFSSIHEEENKKNLAVSKYLKSAALDAETTKSVLNRYGWHTYDCHYNLGHDCNCGFEKEK